MKYLPVTVIALFIIIITTSCGNVKNFQYLQGSFDTARISKVEIHEPVIQKGDLLNISIYSDDAQSTAAVTRQAGGPPPVILSTDGGASLGSTGPSSTGYLVDQQGNLQIFKLGVLHVEGLTKVQLADTLEYFYTKQDLLKNPYVEVRLLNYKITIIGEVNHPGPITIPSDKISAYEAVGLAGDITNYGRRDNVLIVREINGVRTFARIDLRDPNVFLSPYYYLHQNDLVVVDVSKAKASVNNQNKIQYVSLGASILSIAVVIISLFRR